VATTTLTRNLKLRVSSDLTDDSKYNLRTIDNLGSIYQIDTNAVAKMRSKSDILIQTNDPDIGGNGSGGTVLIGSTDQPISELQINADIVNLSSPLSISDSATGGTQSLLFNYKSDINGSVDAGANRTLNVDLEGDDRNLVLGGNLSILGASLELTLSADLSWTLPPDNGLSGQVLTTDGLGALNWTAASANFLDGLSDVQINTPLEGQTVLYNATSGQWENGTVTASIGAETAYIWTPADGTTRTISHNLGSQQIIATIIDTTDNYKTVEVPDTTRPDGNTIILTSTSAPVGGNWLVLLKQIIT